MMVVCNLVFLVLLLWKCVKFVMEFNFFICFRIFIWVFLNFIEFFGSGGGLDVYVNIVLGIICLFFMELFLFFCYVLNLDDEIKLLEYLLVFDICCIVEIEGWIYVIWYGMVWYLEFRDEMGL